MNATDSLLRTLQVAQLSQSSFISDGDSLRQFVVLLLNPLLLEPQYHKPICCRSSRSPPSSPRSASSASPRGGRCCRRGSWGRC